MTETELLAAVIARCSAHGVWWLHVRTPHHNQARDNTAGFPDLFLCGRGGVAFWELKSHPREGLSDRQRDWKHALMAAGQTWAKRTPADLASGLIDRDLDRLAGLPAAPA